MSLTYYKRYRMECDLRRAPAALEMRAGYRLIAWTPDLVEAHAETKFESFRLELDGQIFRNLGSRAGCHELMQAISRRPGFLPEATWLVEFSGVEHKPEYCGAIQGVRSTPRYGGIQNVGVTAEHRGRGLGSMLVAAALMGFRQAGLRRAYLEVTAENEAAIRLYQRLGFRRVKTVYHPVEVAYERAGR